MLKYILFSSLIFASVISQAQEFETVVQETIFNSSDRVVIDKAQIEKSKAPTITSLLATQANLSVSSTPFQPTSLFMRGGDSGHILILVDDVPFYDATTIQRSFNLNSLDIRTVEKIEIIKGSQSVLFGGQALSGVIKITTIPSQARKPVVVVEAGTHDKANIGAAYQKNGDQDLVSVRARVGTKNNQSPVLDSDKLYPNKNLSTDLIYRYDAEWFVQGKLSYLADDANSPSTGGSFQTIDADDFVIKNDQTSISVLTGSKKLSLLPLLTFSHQWSKRSFEQPSTATDQVYDGQVSQIRAEGRVLDLEKSQLLVGAQYTEETMIFHDLGIQVTDKFSELSGVFAKYDLALNQDFKFSAGARYEAWDSQDGVATGQLGLVFRENTKLEFATGFKAPSLFQLYAKDYGNPELDAEKSVSYSLSHQKAISKDMNASMTLFYTEFSNLIQTQGAPPATRYYNVAKSNTKGVEMAYSWNFARYQQLSLVAGYQEPWDETNHRWLLRRALTTASLRYGVTVDQLVTQAELVAVGSRGDRTGLTTYGEIPGYMIGNLSGTYNFSDVYNGYIRIDNVANYRYQSSYSYYAEGIAATLGFSALF